MTIMLQTWAYLSHILSWVYEHIDTCWKTRESMLYSSPKVIINDQKAFWVDELTPKKQKSYWGPQNKNIYCVLKMH